MRKNYFTLLLLVPTAAYADAEDIFYFVAVEAGLLIAVVIVMSSIRFAKFEQKVWIFVAYLIGAAGSAYATRNLAYSRNLVFINSICLVVPLITWLSSLYFVYRYVNRRH